LERIGRENTGRNAPKTGENGVFAATP